MRVHKAALKHGVRERDSIRLDFDTVGLFLEMVVLVFDSGNELVIHATKARPQMYDLLP